MDSVRLSNETRTDAITPKRPKGLARPRCGAAGCATAPTDGKPYCIDHLDRLLRVAELMVELAFRDDETARGERSEPVTADGPLAHDVLSQLELRGVLTLGHLGRELSVSSRSLGTCLDALEARGEIVRATLRDRGRQRRVVALASAKPLLSRRAS